MMKQINNLDYQYIVATDLAARGIDIEGVSHIINYELPSDLDFYIHRTGRTARAGKSGIAATIYDQSDEDALIRLEKMGIVFHDADIKMVIGLKSMNEISVNIVKNKYLKLM